MPQPCKLCKTDTTNDRGVCNDCLGALGFATPIPKAEPPQKGCARCGHLTLIRALLRERTYSGSEKLEPQAITFGYVKGFWGMSPSEITGERFGVMEARICKSCGFTDLFTQSPAEIPIGPEYGTELIEVPEPGPYR